MPAYLLGVIKAVEHLHSHGVVHRTLQPEVIFQSCDPRRPLFIGGHELTTQISNMNLNLKLPDSPYKLIFSDKRAGSKRQDLCALAGILVAWQVGVEIYEKKMKKTVDRLKFMTEFAEDQKYLKEIREIVKGTVLAPDRCFTIANIK